MNRGHSFVAYAQSLHFILLKRKFRKDQREPCFIGIAADRDTAAVQLCNGADDRLAQAAGISRLVARRIAAKESLKQVRQMFRRNGMTLVADADFHLAIS